MCPGNGLLWHHLQRFKLAVPGLDAAYIFVCVCMCVCVRERACPYARLRTSVRPSTRVHEAVCLPCLSPCFPSACSHTHTHTHTHSHTHTHTHTLDLFICYAHDRVANCASTGLRVAGASECRGDAVSFGGNTLHLGLGGTASVHLSSSFLGLLLAMAR